MAVKITTIAEEPPLDNSIEEEYTPPRLLDLPEMPDSDQYVYRWIRFRVNGEEDYSNISARLREGWEFVRRSDLPETFVTPILQSKLDVLQGAAIFGDLVLAKIPRKKAEARQKYTERAAQEAEAAYNARMIRTEENVVLDNSASRRSVSFGRRPRLG